MQLSDTQLRQLLAQAGFTGSGLETMVKIVARESGNNPDAYNGNVGTGDNSVGLSQINILGDLLPGRAQILNSLGIKVDPNDAAAVKTALQDPLTNLKVAYELSNQGTQFNPWKSTAGDVPGGGSLNGGSGMPDGPGYQKWLSDYAALHLPWKPLDDKLAPYLQPDGKGGWKFPDGSGFDPTVGFVIPVYNAEKEAYKNVTVMQPDEWVQYRKLSDQLDTLDQQYQTQYPAFSLDDAIKRATFGYNSDRGTIDAQNAATKVAQELDVRTKATSLVNQELSQQGTDQKTAMDSLANHQRGQPYLLPSSVLPSADQLFEQAVATVKKGLPDAPKMPYYSSGLPGAGAPTLDAVHAAATAQATEQAASSAANAAKKTWSSFGTGAPNPLVDQSATAAPSGGLANSWVGRIALNSQAGRRATFWTPGAAAPAIPGTSSGNPWDTRQPPLPNNRPQVGLLGSLFYSR